MSMSGGFATFVRLLQASGPSRVWHAYDGDGMVACGAAGELAEGEIKIADARAIAVRSRPVCGNCRDVLDNRRRDASVALTPTRATGPEGGTMTTATKPKPKARTKAASKELLDPAKYATTSAGRLREERATLSNRLSGVSTQIKRSTDDKKTKALERRQADLKKRRDKVNAALAKKTDDVAEATQARAAAKSTKPSESEDKSVKPDDDKGTEATDEEAAKK